MPRTARLMGNSGYYHIVARGIGKQILFEEDSDYLFFLRRLRKIQLEEEYSIIAYCLMENHYHLLLRIDSGLDRVMKKLATSYAYYYNTKYERVGHLFQDRYTSRPIESDEYLLSAVRYIHNNPAKAGICPANRYRWSSWRTYCGKKGIADPEPVLALTGGVDGFLKFSEQEDDGTAHLEIRERRQLSDRSAQEIIRSRLKLESGTQIQQMERKERNQALRELRAEGLSLRQIERLTGVNRRTISQA